MRRFAIVVLAVLGFAFIAAQAYADSCAPAKVTDLHLGTGKTTAALSWTDPGDDCNTGTAFSYEVRRSGATITDTNWQSATIVATGNPAGANGTADCKDFTGLNCGQTYYWVIFFFDAAGNRSPISNLVSGAQRSCSGGIEVACP